MYLRDTVTGKRLRTLPRYPSKVNAIVLTHDDRRAVAATADGMLKVWEVHSGNDLLIIDGHRDYIADLIVTPDDQHVISASWDNSIKIWRLDNGQLVAAFTGEQPMSAVAVADDGIAVVAGTNWDRIHFLKIEGLKT